MPDKPPVNRPDYTLLSMAMNIGAAIVLLVLLGHWLDSKFHTSAVFTLTGAVLGIIFMVIEAWRGLK